MKLKKFVKNVIPVGLSRISKTLTRTRTKLRNRNQLLDSDDDDDEVIDIDEEMLLHKDSNSVNDNDNDNRGSGDWSREWDNDSEILTKAMEITKNNAAVASSSSSAVAAAAAATLDLTASTVATETTTTVSSDAEEEEEDESVTREGNGEEECHEHQDKNQDNADKDNDESNDDNDDDNCDGEDDDDLESSLSKFLMIAPKYATTTTKKTKSRMSPSGVASLLSPPISSTPSIKSSLPKSTDDDDDGDDDAELGHDESWRSLSGADSISLASSASQQKLDDKKSPKKKKEKRRHKKKKKKASSQSKKNKDIEQLLQEQPQKVERPIITKDDDEPTALLYSTELPVKSNEDEVVDHDVDCEKYHDDNEDYEATRATTSLSSEFRDELYNLLNHGGNRHGSMVIKESHGIAALDEDRQESSSRNPPKPLPRMSRSTIPTSSSLTRIDSSVHSRQRRRSRATLDRSGSRSKSSKTTTRRHRPLTKDQIASLYESQALWYQSPHSLKKKKVSLTTTTSRVKLPSSAGPLTKSSPSSTSASTGTISRPERKSRRARRTVKIGSTTAATKTDAVDPKLPTRTQSHGAINGSKREIVPRMRRSNSEFSIDNVNSATAINKKRISANNKQGKRRSVPTNRLRRTQSVHAQATASKLL